jgi:DNA helicase-2/ATP-dependent DNA helicase PcrA
MGLDIKRYSPRLLSNAISNLKNELIDPGQAMASLSDESDDLAHIVASVYGEYQRRLRTANALDFDDLIGETVAVLQAFPEIAGYYRRRFRHVLVDEYQDTNHAQYVLVRELVGRDAGESSDDVPPAELCVVGDADQSIYAFRGATIRNIEDFERDYPDAKTILLEQNYRSTQNILSAANSVIARNSGRREKRLWTDEGAGELIVGYVADNEHDEARFVAEEVDALADRGDITYNDVAVFYRTNNSSRSLDSVQSCWGSALLRAQGDSRHRRVPAGAGQPRRRGEHAAHPEHPAPWHRRSRGGLFVGLRREHRLQLRRCAAGRGRRQGADAEQPGGEGDRGLRRAARRAAGPPR